MATRIKSEVIERMLELHERCVVCGSTYMLHIHHRIFISEGEIGVKKHLETALKTYQECYNAPLAPWRLHDVQNLIRICLACHEGPQGVHGGNERLRQELRNSFTDPITGFNVPFYRQETLF